MSRFEMLPRIITKNINLLKRTKPFISQCVFCSSNLDDEKFTTIYRLPFIQYAAAFNKIKVYQIGLTTVGIPSSFCLEMSSYLEKGSCAIFSTVGITGTITLLLTGWAIKNLIGFVYINEKRDKIRISFIDFWGKRKNTELYINDLIPPSEIPKTKLNVYDTIKTHNEGSESYKIIHRFGGIKDYEKYTYVFGDV